MPGIVEDHPTTHIIEVSTVMCHDIVDIPHTLTGTVQSSVAMGGLTLGPNQCTVGTGAAAEGAGAAAEGGRGGSRGGQGGLTPPNKIGAMTTECALLLLLHLPDVFQNTLLLYTHVCR